MRRIVILSVMVLAIFSGILLADVPGAHGHASLVVPSNLEFIKKLSPKLLEEIYEGMGGETDDNVLKEKANAAAKTLYEGMKGVAEFQSYTKRIPQFDVAVFRGVEKLDKFNAFFFGGINKSRKCQLGNTLFISEKMVSLLTSEELLLAMAHELVHQIKAHKCLAMEKKLAFYEGELIKVLPSTKEIDEAGGEVAYLKKRFAKPYNDGAMLIPKTPEYDAFVSKGRVFTSEVDAEAASVLIISKMAKFKLDPVLYSFYEKSAKALREPFPCEQKTADYTVKDYMASFEFNLNTPDGTLHPPICTQYLHMKQEALAHGL